MNSKSRVFATALLGVPLVLSACWGGEEAGPAAAAGPKVEAAPTDRLDATWPVVFATEDSVAEYGGTAGWLSLVMKRDCSGCPLSVRTVSGRYVWRI